MHSPTESMVDCKSALTCSYKAFALSLAAKASLAEVANSPSSSSNLAICSPRFLDSSVLAAILLSRESILSFSSAIALFKVFFELLERQSFRFALCNCLLLQSFQEVDDLLNGVFT